MTSAATTSSTASAAAPICALISRHMLGGAGGSGIGAGARLTRPHSGQRPCRVTVWRPQKPQRVEIRSMGRRGSVPAVLSGPHTLGRMIQTGEQAPDFELPDHDGNPVRLSALRGRPVVL